MEVVIVDDSEGFQDGWSTVARDVRTRQDALQVVRYLSLNPPVDAFDLGAFDAALAAIGS